MRCPFCGNEETQVKDSRPTEDNSSIRRRRQCTVCGARFTTFERVQIRELIVINNHFLEPPMNGYPCSVGLILTIQKMQLVPL